MGVSAVHGSGRLLRRRTRKKLGWLSHWHCSTKETGKTAKWKLGATLPTLRRLVDVYWPPSRRGISARWLPLRVGVGRHRQWKAPIGRRYYETANSTRGNTHLITNRDCDLRKNWHGTTPNLFRDRLRASPTFLSCVINRCTQSSKIDCSVPLRHRRDSQLIWEPLICCADLQCKRVEQQSSCRLAGTFIESKPRRVANRVSRPIRFILWWKERSLCHGNVVCREKCYVKNAE